MAPAPAPAPVLPFFNLEIACLADQERFVFGELLGKGSYGSVYRAMDKLTGCPVAVKHIGNVFNNTGGARRILRELKMLRLLGSGSDHLVTAKHVMLPSDAHSFQDICIVMEPMDMNMTGIINANRSVLTHMQHKGLIFQALRSLHYLHASKILHRDIKSPNIMVNKNCKLKICDFGLARMKNSNEMSELQWSDYVASRWYRAPELVGVLYGKYTEAVDIWSLGCVFGEILRGFPLFPGRGPGDMLIRIIKSIGTPDATLIDNIQNDKARAFIKTLPRMQPTLIQAEYPRAEAEAVNFLKRMLTFDPASRPSAAELLKDPYFEEIPQSSKSPIVPANIDFNSEFAFEAFDLTIQQIRQLIYGEIFHYHPQYRMQLLMIQQLRIARREASLIESRIEQRQQAHEMEG